MYVCILILENCKWYYFSAASHYHTASLLDDRFLGVGNWLFYIWYSTCATSTHPNFPLTHPLDDYGEKEEEGKGKGKEMGVKRRREQE